MGGVLTGAGGSSKAGGVRGSGRWQGAYRPPTATWQDPDIRMVLCLGNPRLSALPGTSPGRCGARICKGSVGGAAGRKQVWGSSGGMFYPMKR